MKSVATAFARGVDHKPWIQVALGRGGGAQNDGPVGEPCGGAVPVRIRHRHDRFDIKCLRGPDDPKRDLATIGDEKTSDRHQFATSANRGCPASTMAPSSARTAWTRPVCSERTAVNSFITSIRQSS